MYNGDKSRAIWGIKWVNVGCTVLRAAPETWQVLWNCELFLWKTGHFTQTCLWISFWKKFCFWALLWMCITENTLGTTHPILREDGVRVSGVLGLALLSLMWMLSASLEGPVRTASWCLAVGGVGNWILTSSLLPAVRKLAQAVPPTWIPSRTTKISPGLEAPAQCHIILKALVGACPALLTPFTGVLLVQHWPPPVAWGCVSYQTVSDQKEASWGHMPTFLFPMCLASLVYGGKPSISAYWVQVFLLLSTYM